MNEANSELYDLLGEIAIAKVHYREELDNLVTKLICLKDGLDKEQHLLVSQYIDNFKRYKESLNSKENKLEIGSRKLLRDNLK